MGVYQSEIECEVCGAQVPFEFDEPGETTEATCPGCDTYYPELYV